MATSKPKPSTPEDYTTLLDKLRQWAATPKGAPAQPAYNPLPTTPVKKSAPVKAATPAKSTPAKSTPAKSTTPAKTQTQPTGQRPGSYGWKPPGPTTIDRSQQPLQRGELRPYYSGPPAYTETGIRAILSDNVLAGEDLRRQIEAAGGRANFRESGNFRPWSSYTDAEKYYRRYGVMPQGEQMPFDTSGVEAMAASRQQTERLVKEHLENYGRYPDWDRSYRMDDPFAASAAPVEQQLAPVAAQMAGISAQPTTNQRAIPTTDEGKLQAAREIVNQYTGADTAAMEYDGLFNTLSTYQPSQEIFPQYMNDILWLSTILEQ